MRPTSKHSGHLRPEKIPTECRRAGFRSLVRGSHFAAPPETSVSLRRTDRRSFETVAHFDRKEAFRTDGVRNGSIAPVGGMAAPCRTLHFARRRLLRRHCSDGRALNTQLTTI